MSGVGGRYHGAVVITGASSGIGRDATLALARGGWFVFAGVRAANDGRALAAAAGGLGLGAAVHPVCIDVTARQSIAESAQHVDHILAANRLGLVGIINNAGIAVAGPIEEVPIERLRAILETNVVGAAAMIQVFLPRLRTDRGRIINISSVSGRVAAPYLGAYAASKFALEALSDALRVELRPWHIPVSLIVPGPIATPIWAKSDAAARSDRIALVEGSPYATIVPRVRATMQQAGARGLPVARVSAAIIAALTASRPRARYYVARHPYQLEFFARCCPDRLRDWIFARAFR